MNMRERAMCDQPGQLLLRRLTNGAVLGESCDEIVSHDLETRWDTEEGGLRHPTSGRRRRRIPALAHPGAKYRRNHAGDQNREHGPKQIHVKVVAESLG